MIDQWSSEISIIVGIEYLDFEKAIKLFIIVSVFLLTFKTLKFFNGNQKITEPKAEDKVKIRGPLKIPVTKPLINKTGGTIEKRFILPQGFQRIDVSPNSFGYYLRTLPLKPHETFRSYLNMVSAYASTLSLEKELTKVSKGSMEIGDVFIKGADPGHAIIVLDMAEDKSTGEKLFLLGQSYMPAQETQILCNNQDKGISPWYSLNLQGKLYTPQWTFDENQLRRFK